MGDTKLLIVDDEEIIIDPMVKYFQRKGYEVVSAMNREEAIKIYNSFSPDICIIDIHMVESPREGIRILKEIKEINKDAICIMLTRITDVETVEQARELGALHYLLKPFRADALAQRVYEAECLVKERKKDG